MLNHLHHRVQSQMQSHSLNIRHRHSHPTLVLLLSLLLLSTLPFSSSLQSPSSSTGSSDVLSRSPTSASGRSDVWSESSTTGGDDSGPTSPDTTSYLSCPDLDDSAVLSFNQSIVCTIECRQYTWATAGKVSDYSWSAEEMSDSATEESVVMRLRRGVADGSDSGGSGSGRDSTTDVRFGTVSNFATYNDSKVIAFNYTAPAIGSVGILHVMTGDREIENSPIVFTLNAPPDNDNSTTPIVTPPADTAKSSFLSLSNPAFLAVCGVALVLLLAAVLGGLWARRVFARKADEVRERQVSERQWAHSVPSLKARLDVPHPSTLSRSSLSSPLLR